MNKNISLFIFFLLLLTSRLFSLDITGVWELSADTLINEDIHVFPGGEILPSSPNVVLTVNGNFINEGTVANYFTGGTIYYLDLLTSETLNNSGTLSNRSVTLNGTTGQTVATTSTTPLRTQYFYVNNIIPVKAVSDLHFMNSQIIFSGGGGFDLSDGYDIYINGGYLSGASVYGPEHYAKSQTKIALSNDAYIYNTSIYRTDTDGSFLVKGENCILIGPMTNFGKIEPADTFTTILTSIISFTNLGTVDGDMSFSVAGDLLNEGYFYNSTIIFSGSECQKLACSFPPVRTEMIYCTNPEGIILISDFRYYGLDNQDFGIDFGNNPIYLNGFDMYVEGAKINNVAITGIIENNIPSSSILYPKSSATSVIPLDGCRFNNVNLFGEFLIYNNVTFEGTVVNYGYISGLYYNNGLTVNGDLINDINLLGYSGSVMNGYDNDFTVYVNGSIHNASVWDNSRIIFGGSGEQNISCDEDKPFAVGTLECTNPNGIKAASDIYFTGTGLELTGHSFDLYGNDLNLSGGYIDSTLVISTYGTSRSLFTSDSSNSCYIESSIINGIDLDGIVEFKGTGNILNGQVMNYGILRNVTTGNSAVNILGNFYNKGTIADNGQVYKMTTNIKGDITNYGVWDNNYIYFNGEDDQVINLPGGTEINGGKRYFVAESDSAPYEWYFNELPLYGDPWFNGTDDKYLGWEIPVGLAYSGIFYCETGEGTSRKIFVCENGPATPVITEFILENGKGGLDWDPVAYAVSYKVYSSDDPYKDISLWTYEGETTSSNFTLWDQNEGKRFYKVTAIY